MWPENFNNKENIEENKDRKKNNLPEKTQSDLESEHFSHYITEALYKMGEPGLAELIHAKDKKIMALINLEARKAAITGDQVEKTNPEGFDVVEHMKMRAEIFSQQLIQNKEQYFN